GTLQAENTSGTARRTPGSKTPRKVQWASDRANSAHDQSRPASPHALDEYGRDVSFPLYRTLLRGTTPNADELFSQPNAFSTLADALERHRSQSPSSRSPHLHSPPPHPSGADHDITTTTNSTTPTTPGSLPSPSRSVPGENFIDPAERSGL